MKYQPDEHDEILRNLQSVKHKIDFYGDDLNLIALAYNTKDDTVALIYSDGSYDDLRKSFKDCLKQFASTNWGGCDSLDRTLYFARKKLTGNSFPYSDSVAGFDGEQRAKANRGEHIFSFDRVLEIEDE